MARRNDHGSPGKPFQVEAAAFQMRGVLTMLRSHMLRMPELSDLEIPLKQREINLPDSVIFSDILDRKRSLAEQTAPAAKGDYVLAILAEEGRPEQLVHVELGSSCGPGYGAELLGCRAGDTLNVRVFGKPAGFRVLSVKKVVEYELTDENIAALGIPGIETLSDYRRDYIRAHGRERAERIFSAIRGKLLSRLNDMMELSLDESEVGDFHQSQREMIQSISGDVDQRLLDGYGGGSVEEADRRFMEDNRQTFRLYVWGRELAVSRGRNISEEERRRLVENYAMIHELDEETAASDELRDEVERPFYLQYAVDAVKRHYLSLVRFRAEGIPPMSL